MARLLAARVAVITGAGSGIGRAIAQAMAQEGATIAACDRNVAGSAETIASIGGASRSFACDVSDRAACDRVAAEIVKAFGRVDILVNSAGIVRRAGVGEPNARAVWDEIIRTNLDGVYNMATAFADHLVASRGCIVNLASTHAFVAGPQITAYTASKAGVHSLTFSLAAELGPRGVRVNAIAPGYTETPMNLGPPGAPTFQERFGPRTPLGRPAQPEDIALPAVFLASDMARYITGVTLRVDGGYLCF
jgi:NAD(P)-dependent dehydrogenase (short-subunit alcohol dehydrogenase family)